jgi:carbamoyltransferase
MIEIAADLIADEKVVGWFQGRMEFGPRALGARSIIGDPRSEKMQKVMNLKVKYRESFRPFAPSVLREDVSRYFETDIDSPYMLLVDKVKPEICRKMTAQESQLFGIDKLNVKRSELPAITHVDYTARVQTVHRETNPLYYDLIKKFKEKTDCGVVINTSFNVRGEPPACSPEDSFKCFMGTEMDALVVGNCVLYKEQQDQALKLDYKSAFELD